MKSRLCFERCFRDSTYLLKLYSFVHFFGIFKFFSLNLLFIFFFFYINTCVFFFKKICIYLFVWLCCIFIAVYGLSLLALSGDYFQLQCMDFLQLWLLLLWSVSSRACRLQQLWHIDSCSAGYGIFPDQRLNPCPLHLQVDSVHTTREVHSSYFSDSLHSLPFFLIICLTLCLKAPQRQG